MSTLTERPSLITLLRSRVTLVWIVLIAATALSWMLGTDHGISSDDQSVASVVILLVAFVKIRFIGLWFMELREAPWILRGLFEAYCLIVGTMTIVLFVVI